MFMLWGGVGSRGSRFAVLGPPIPSQGRRGLSRGRLHPLVSPFLVGYSEPHGESLTGKLRHTWGSRGGGDGAVLCRRPFPPTPDRIRGSRTRREEAAGWGVRIPAGSREEMGWTGREGGRLGPGGTLTPSGSRARSRAAPWGLSRTL